MRTSLVSVLVFVTTTVILPQHVVAQNSGPAVCEAPTCEEAIDLNAPGSPCEFGLPCEVPFDTRSCNPETVDIFGCRDSGATTTVGRTLYFKYLPDSNLYGEVTVSSCESDPSFDSVIAIYNNCDQITNDYLDCGDDTCGIPNGPAEADFIVCVVCSPWYIAVSGVNGQGGTGVFRLSYQMWQTAVCSCLSPAAPLANPAFDVNGTEKACSLDADCQAGETGPNSQTVCRDGSCYVARQRYLSVRPNPANTGASYAMRVSLDTGVAGSTALGFVQAATNISAGANNGPSSYDKSQIGATPFYQDWTTVHSGIISIGDCEISPGHTYVVQTIVDGADTGDEANYSAPLRLPTCANNGDVTGGGSPGDPPNGAQGSLVDVFAQVLGFQSNGNEPLDWLDTDPATGAANPNLIVNLADAFTGVQAFQQNPYPGPAPLDCP